MIQQKKANDLKSNIVDYRDFLTSFLEKGSPLSDNIIKQLDTSDSRPNLKEGGERKRGKVHILKINH